MTQFLDSLGTTAVRAGILMFGQSAILVGVLWSIDRLALRRCRAALRHALWMLVVFKLLLPPSLLVPTGVGFWLGRWLADPVVESVPASVAVAFPATEGPTDGASNASPRVASGSGRGISTAIVLGMVWLAGSLALAAWRWRRNRAVRLLLAGSRPGPDEFAAPLRAAAAELGLRRAVRLRLTRSNHSPAVCGLFRPVILMPAAMADALGPDALRDVLRHELAHVQRHDLASNFLQAVVQIAWWWNPLVWFANARIRSLREQAVDECVMLLGPTDVPTYPATLVAIARHCTATPALALGFVGILERPNALGTRVRRLLDAPLPRRAHLGVSGWLAVAVAALLGLPMAYARRVERPTAKPGFTTPAAPRPFGDPAFPPLPDSPAADPTSSPTTNTARRLFTRTFRVNPITFPQALASVVGLPAPEPGKPTPTIPDGLALRTIRDFFAAAGVSFPSVAPDPDRTAAEPQKAMFYSDHTGILWVRATSEDLDTVEKAIQVLNVAPPQLHIEAQFLEVDADVVQKHLDAQYRKRTANQSGTPGDAAKPLPGPTFTGLLADAELRALLAAIRREPGTKSLATPSVVTLSGRQAQIQAVDLVTVVDRAANTTNQIPIGPSLDVIPYVTADDLAINLTVVASLTQIDGHTDDPLHLPVIGTRTMTTSAITRSGQTVVLAGASTGGAHRRELLVFVTATIVDPAGRPVNPPATPPKRDN